MLVYFFVSDSSSSKSSPSFLPLASSSSLLEKTLISPSSHLITPHLLLSSLFLLCLACPPLCDLLDAFLHALGHSKEYKVVQDLLSNIYTEMDEVLLIYYPLLCALNSAGMERYRDETTFTHVSVA